MIFTFWLVENRIIGCNSEFFFTIQKSDLLMSWKHFEIKDNHGINPFQANVPILYLLKTLEN